MTNVQKAIDMYGLVEGELTASDLLKLEFDSPILTPSELTEVHGRLIESEVGFSHTLGWFLSRLVKSSYDAGNNDFVFEADSGGIDSFGVRLNGNEAPIRLDVRGNLGNNAFSHSRNVEAKVEQGLGLYGGICTENLKLQVGGDADSGLAIDSKYFAGLLNNVRDFVGARSYCFSAIIQGNAGEGLCNYAKNPRVFVEGTAGFGAFTKANGGYLVLCGQEAKELPIYQKILQSFEQKTE
jgi:formylmethanofuran dehydrogenase subunit C